MSSLTQTHIRKCLTLIDNPDNLAEPQRLHRLFELEWDYHMVEDPIEATLNGYPGQNHRWPDWSPAAIARRKENSHVWLRGLKSIDRSKLSREDIVSYDIFEHYLNDEIEGNGFPAELMPISQMDGPHQWIAFVTNTMPLFKLADCDDILKRLKAAPEWFDQTIDLMNDGLSKGVTPPGSILHDVPQQILNQITEEAADAPSLAILKKFPSTITSSEQADVRREAESVFRDLLIPAFEKLHKYVAETYLPGCRDSIACRDLPDGENWYPYLVRSYTTTNMTPDEVFETGQNEVTRIRHLMDEVIAGTHFKGDFAAFTEFLRTDPQFYHTQARDLVAEYRDISKRADPELAKLFGKLPTLPYGVIPIPSYAEKSQTTAYYQPGSLEAGRPGYYFVNTYDLKSRPRWEMEPLTLHEAVPGHHLQIALAQELKDLPEFRKKGWVTAYGEGWALYAESLGTEMGFYTSPYSRFGQLTYEMWRAVRLMVDVGMHWKGWTRQQAIDFVMENSGKAEHDVTVEIDRYIVWPGQAIAYKIGELRMQELRARATKSLGDKFSIREFHDRILGNGAMPLSLLENLVDRWIKEKHDQ
ncbi:MAG: DUF885 domain-containing protein [Candidatus Zixiibacteriota bacterium]|nr:MAG: DUF885 domain-containing protein [candidate division Zixibacteria bacterium]